jgi:arylsulfatase A-like enzyme
MNRKSRFLFAFVVIVCSVLTAAAEEKPVSPRRPNVLFIMTDQQRWDCVGANGNAIIQTPNMDRLAARGANFSHAFVSSPVCVPSRISFFTGRYAHSHRNRVNYTPLDHSEILLQARLKEAGYRTASVGKLHYFPPTVEEAQRTGFDIVELHDGVPFTDKWSDYVKWRQANDPKKDIVNYRATAKDIAPGKNPFRAEIDTAFTDTAWTGERARHYLTELAHGAQPFFLYVSFWKPHSPYEVGAPYDSMYDSVQIPIAPTVTAEGIPSMPLPLQKLATRENVDFLLKPERLQWVYRSYYGAISHVDREIGLLLDALEASGQAENTLIVFSSDHGDQLFEHHINGKNCFFESSVRVPFMVSLPGRIKPGRYDQMIETVDLVPTLLEFTGVPEPRDCQGRSFAPLIADMGRTYTPHTEVFSENIIPEVITSGKMDLPFEKGKGVDGIRHPDAKMVRTERWKYCYYPDGYSELYDLPADPLETNNLAGKPESREVEYDLRTRLLNWLIDSAETDEIAPRWLLSDPKPNLKK